MALCDPHSPQTQPPYGRLHAASPASPADRPAFAAVAVRPRQDGWTPERQVGFIEALAECGCVDEACKRVGMGDQLGLCAQAAGGAREFRAACATAIRPAMALGSTGVAQSARRTAQRSRWPPTPTRYIEQAVAAARAEAERVETERRGFRATPEETDAAIDRRKRDSGAIPARTWRVVRPLPTTTAAPVTPAGEASPVRSATIEARRHRVERVALVPSPADCGKTNHIRCDRLRSAPS